MPRQVELIGAAWGLGGPEPGCAEAPAVLIPLLVEQLQRCGVPVRAGPILSPTFTERRKQLAVSKLCGLLASAVADSLRRRHRSLARRGARPQGLSRPRLGRRAHGSPYAAHQPHRASAWHAARVAARS